MKFANKDHLIMISFEEYFEYSFLFEANLTGAGKKERMHFSLNLKKKLSSAKIIGDFL